MDPRIKIAAGVGILYWLYRNYDTQKLVNAAAQQAALVQAAQNAALQQTALQQTAPSVAVQAPVARPTAAQAPVARPAAEQAPVARPAAEQAPSRPVVVAQKPVETPVQPLASDDAGVVLAVGADTDADLAAVAEIQPVESAPQVVEASPVVETPPVAVKKPAPKLRVVFGGDDDAEEEIGLAVKPRAKSTAVPVAASSAAPVASKAPSVAVKQAAPPLKEGALRHPANRDEGSLPVTTEARDVLHTPDVQRHLSKKFVQTLDLIQPAVIPFDALSEEMKALLLRGFAADYVMPKAIPEPGYSAAVAASTATGLPIGWTQMLIARGVPIDKVGQVAVDLIATLTDAAQTEAQQTPVGPMNLKRLRGTLMGRFAPLPEGASMGGGY